MYEHKLIATALSSIYKWLYCLPSIFLNMLFFIFSIITFTVRGEKTYFHFPKRQSSLWKNGQRPHLVNVYGKYNGRLVCKSTH